MHFLGILFPYLFAKNISFLSVPTHPHTHTHGSQNTSLSYYMHTYINIYRAVPPLWWLWSISWTFSCYREQYLAEHGKRRLKAIFLCFSLFSDLTIISLLLSWRCSHRNSKDFLSEWVSQWKSEWVSQWASESVTEYWLLCMQCNLVTFTVK